MHWSLKRNLFSHWWHIDSRKGSILCWLEGRFSDRSYWDLSDGDSSRYLLCEFCIFEPHVFRLLTGDKVVFPGGSDSKESAHNAGNLGSIPGLGRFTGGRHGNPLQHSCLENPHGQRSLVGYSPWGHKELDTTEGLSAAHVDIKIKWKTVCF